MTTVWEVNNNSYHLNDEQTRVADDYSAKEPNDAAFNKWFVEYCAAEGIKPKSYSRARYWSHVPNSTSVVDKLVSVKQSAITLMRVVDPRIKPSDIDFDSGEAPIIIPSEHAVEADTLHEAMDNTAGFAIHAAFKHRFNDIKKSWSVGLAKKSYEFSAVEGIENVLSTIRSNIRGVKENPGFGGYIDEAIDRTYNGYKLPTEFPKDDSGKKLAAIMAHSLYGDRVGDPNSVDYADKIKKANELVDEFINRENITKNNYQMVVHNLMDLLDLDPSDHRNPPPVPMEMGLNDAGEGLDDETKKIVDDRIEMEQERIESDEYNIGFAEGREEHALIKVRPFKIGNHRIETVGGSIVKADAQLRLRKTLDKRTERFQKSGDLDEDELYRLMQGDSRVFMNVEEEQEESASIHFLVDISGSMNGYVDDAAYGYRSGSRTYQSKIDAAAQLAWLFAHSMNKRTYVKCHVWAHTGDSSIDDGAANYRAYSSTTYHNGPIVYDIWKSGEPLDRLHLLVNLRTHDNYDGYAIDFVGGKLAKEEAEKKYLIVLSDGYPAGHGYGGEEAKAHVREVTDSLIRKGIHVVQLAIGGDLGEEQSKMFKYFVEYKNIDQLIREFAKILDKAR